MELVSICIKCFDKDTWQTIKDNTPITYFSASYNILLVSNCILLLFSITYLFLKSNLRKLMVKMYINKWSARVFVLKREYIIFSFI